MKETIEDIIKEMRNSTNDNICPHWADGGGCDYCPMGGQGKNCIFDKLADRLEAALKHEREHIGNIAKMREALETVRDAHFVREENDEDTEGFEVEADDGTGRPLICVVEDALTAPVRNCDVGTAEEQAKRMDRFCASHGMHTDGGFVCENCNLYRVFNCKLHWAQMPYKEEG